MASHARVALTSFLACLVLRSAAIVGDQAPPPYPILDVHIPEPIVGALDRKWAAEDGQQSALKLDEVAERIAAADELMQSSMAPLAAKIESAAAAAEAAIRAAAGESSALRRK